MILLDAALLTILALVAFGVVRTVNLFAIVILLGVYSLMSATWFILMDAVDVGFTEAAVGAGLSTLFLLAAMARTGPARPAMTSGRWRAGLALFGVVSVGLFLIYACTGLPAVGDPDSAAMAHLGRQFMQRTPLEIEIPNVVTAVLASYRGFDTLGEIVVIFTAALGVTMLIHSETASTSEPEPEPHIHEILPVVSRLMLPFIILFAFYVQFHGDYGPGGGFQAGVIVAVGIISHSLVAGPDWTRHAFPPVLAHSLAALGVLVYGGVGIVCMLRGGAFLDYDFLLPGSHAGQHLGILLVELGVLITVTGAMLSIFYALTGRAGHGQFADE